jgi:hypothetical protein
LFVTSDEKTPLNSSPLFYWYCFSKVSAYCSVSSSFFVLLLLLLPLRLFILHLFHPLPSLDHSEKRRERGREGKGREMGRRGKKRRRK